MDLGFDDGERASQFGEGGGGFFGRRGDDVIGRGDAGIAEELLGLVLVDFHPATPTGIVSLELNFSKTVQRIQPPALPGVARGLTFVLLQNPRQSRGLTVEFWGELLRVFATNKAVEYSADA